MSISTRAIVGLCVAGLVWLGGAVLCRGEEPAPALEKGFLNPPDSARPWVYWFWLNGNITKAGITADLEAMKRVGIGGVLIMEVDQGAPLGPVAFMGPQWRELFRHVVAESQRLGLEVNMNDDAGWNGSGGPWIKPEQSMQKVVWSETALEGPRRFDGTLPQPQATAGFYRDIAVLAFPAPGAFRIENIQAKACYQVGGVGPAAKTILPPEMTIDRGRVADLSAQMDKSGRLRWDVPAGKWTVLRFGHTSTGMENAPSPASGRGLECDKLSTEGSEAAFAGMIAKLVADVGPAAGKTLVATHVDSWENGAQNWTARMREEFQKRRGYDLLPWLPVMTGRVVGSLEVSERFLWDLRRTVSELVVENYAGHLRKLAREHGMRLSIEAYGGPCDNLAYAGQADEPMCEFWVGGGAMSTCKEMASAAHTYGKRILGAESFTADDSERWLHHPAAVKALGDQAFCDGVNRFVFHRYAMQPWTKKGTVPFFALSPAPGMTMGPWGLHYERTQTWWEWTRPWHAYLARCQYLLRQGLFVADLCYLTGEGSPNGLPPRGQLNPAPPAGYDYDGCTAEVVLSRMSVRDGRLVLPDGMSYRALVLPSGGAMTPALVGKIRELVRAGATVLGPRPERSPSLADYPICDAQVKEIARELWGNCDGQKVTEHRFGRGRVVWGIDPGRLLADAGIRPDFASRMPLRTIHRTADGADIYFVANPLGHDVEAPCAFRVSGRRPELWWPDTGRIEPAAVYQAAGDLTSVSLRLGPHGSVFVVFRGGTGPLDPVVAVSRDGKPVLAAAVPRPKIVVQKATYGVPGDPRRTRDVRARMQQLLDAGQRSVAVAQLAAGDDPAPQVVKTLVVEYTADGRPITVTGRDPDTVYLPDETAKIVVLKAVYGVLGDPARTRDVRAKVQRLVEGGNYGFPVAKMAEGDDPAFGIVKTLVVEYTADGHRVTASGTDPEMIVLSPTGAGVERTVAAGVAADGRLRIDCWQPGRYALRTASGHAHRWQVAALPSYELGGPWEVRFPPQSGAPERVTLDRLISWSDHGDPGVRHFSGTATYTKSFRIPPGMAGMLGPGLRLELELGKVQVMAHVKLNGKDLGILWKPPFRADVTGVVTPGENTLEVQIVNLWVNRMIGDEQLPEDSQRNPNGTLKQWPQWLLDGKPSPTGRTTFTSWRLWKKDSPLQESGLLGPVKLQTAQIIEEPRDSPLR